MQNNVGIYASQISGHLYDGPFGAYDSLASVNPTGTGTVVFAGIPSGYKHLQLRLSALVASATEWQLKLNTNAGVISHYIFGLGSGTPTAGNDPGTANGQTIDTLALSDTYPTVNIVDILDYQNTNKNKTTRWMGGSDRNGSGRLWLGSSLYITTDAITSITLYAGANFTAGTSVALYGVK